jgi:hypothetical protein
METRETKGKLKVRPLAEFIEEARTKAERLKAYYAQLKARIDSL